MHVRYPYGFDRRGRTSGTTEVDHVRDLIEQVLFTNPGERVMRPRFGSGLAQLVFAPNSSGLAEATQFLVQGSLQEQLADVITVDDVRIEAEESLLRVHVAYTIKRSGQRVVGVFQRSAT